MQTKKSSIDDITSPMQKRRTLSEDDDLAMLSKTGNLSTVSLSKTNKRSILKTQPISSSSAAAGITRSSRESVIIDMDLKSQKNVSDPHNKQDSLGRPDGYTKKTTFQLQTRIFSLTLESIENQHDMASSDENLPKQGYNKVGHTPAASSGPPSLASVIASNRALLRPLYLSFIQHDLENEFSKYFVRFNHKRWQRCITVMFGVLTALYVYFMIQYNLDGIFWESAYSVKPTIAACPLGYYWY